MLNYNLKKIIKKFPIIWKCLTWSKDRLLNLSRLKDAVIMTLLLHIWPEQTYRFSTRKLLPHKKNRFSKEEKQFPPYDILKNKCSNLQKMKEINVAIYGSSFDPNSLQKISAPIFLVSFWQPLKIDNKGRIFYNHAEKFIDAKYHESKKYDNYIKKNITYVTNYARTGEIKRFMKNGHNILCVEVFSANGVKNNSSKFEHPEFIDIINYDKIKHIYLVEKIYRPPLLAPYPDWVPSGSFLPSLCALSYFADKINIFGWDNHMNCSPRNMSYWELLLNFYSHKTDAKRGKIQFEGALINFYYAYQISKLPNINIHGHMGQLAKHEKFIKKIERVLFN